ncbi:MAG: hypothetical protein ACT4NX_03050 [Deltaproteobacteria bacterium]
MKRFDLDSRVVERRLREGALNREEYEAYLAALPDVSEKSCPLTANGQVVSDQDFSEIKTDTQEEDK